MMFHYGNLAMYTPKYRRDPYKHYNDATHICYNDLS